jgi:8-oxo-dGTP pyrophosphatase MutT (NUDIX family)
MNDLPPPIPAATLILMRPCVGGAPEILLMQRTQNMAFAAGALVFPGGRIDPQDHELAQRLAPGLEDGAARVAAVRETIEETGLVPALLPAPDPELAQHLRTQLSSGASIGDILDRTRIGIDFDALTPFTRWCPNFRETRRFDARFYIAAAPEGAPPPIVDEAEGMRAFWASAESILAEADAGRAHMIFPTRRNMERLARFASIEEALADAERYPPQCITPWVEERDGTKWVCIPEDAGYPVTRERLETARRR